MTTHLPYPAGCQADTLAATEFTIGRTHYRVELQPSKWIPGDLVWNAYRGIASKYGGSAMHFERIRAVTRSECAKFPKTVGLRAQAFLEQYRTQPTTA